MLSLNEMGEEARCNKRETSDDFWPICGPEFLQKRVSVYLIISLMCIPESPTHGKHVAGG